MTLGAGFASRLRPLMAAAVVGPMAIAFNISAAGIIYQGPLTAFLDRAIALNLVAAMTMGVLSTLIFSYRGTIAQPQNVTAAILVDPGGGDRGRRAGPGLRGRVRDRRGAGGGDGADGGRGHVELTREDGATVVIARCLPGALVGEIGLYAGIPRTALVVAEAPSAFLRMDAEGLERMPRFRVTIAVASPRISCGCASRCGRSTRRRRGRRG